MQLGSLLFLTTGCFDCLKLGTLTSWCICVAIAGRIIGHHLHACCDFVLFTAITGHISVFIDASSIQCLALFNSKQKRSKTHLVNWIIVTKYSSDPHISVGRIRFHPLLELDFPERFILPNVTTDTLCYGKCYGITFIWRPVNYEYEARCVGFDVRAIADLTLVCFLCKHGNIVR